MVCEVTGDLGECGAKCPLYLHTVIHASKMEKTQLHHLTVMVSSKEELIAENIILNEK